MKRSTASAGHTRVRIAQCCYRCLPSTCSSASLRSRVRLPWSENAFPLDDVRGRLDNHTGVVVVVTPNNPTGAVASRQDVRRISAAARNAVVLVDHVYVEYADEDLTPSLLDLENVIVVRTMSKAWGLAGCRVGYAVG